MTELLKTATDTTEYSSGFWAFDPSQGNHSTALHAASGKQTQSFVHLLALTLAFLFIALNAVINHHVLQAKQSSSNQELANLIKNDSGGE